ncbi:hypothetical protein ACQB60_43875 [Actinomycetota bacterium Odt1-20B]
MNSTHKGIGRRITVFQMFDEVFAYTSGSEDGRKLGEVAYVATLRRRTSPHIMWALAREYCKVHDRAPQWAAWILAQSTRSLVTGAGRLSCLTDTGWSAWVEREHHFEVLTSNHEVLRTGHMTIDGYHPVALP